LTVVSPPESEHVQRLLDRAEESLEEGRLPLEMYSDPDIFRLEVENLWGRVWHFLAHESEIAKPGDYVVRNIGPYDSVIVARDEEGNVQAFSNICLHRGMKLCRADLGNTSHFRCPYHGWTYKNKGTLVGVPYRDVVYADIPVLEKYGAGLRKIRIETYRGLVFGNVDGGAAPLDEFLGDFRWYIDLLFDRTDAGFEFYPPLRHVGNFNWKMSAENFSTDNYHIWTTHRVALKLGLVEEGGNLSGYQTSINGHGACCMTGETKGFARGTKMTEFYEQYWPGYTELARRHMSPDKFESFTRLVGSVGTIFPNFSFLTFPSPCPFITFRTWRPLAPDKTEFMTWFAVERDAPEEYKKKSYEDYIFGHSLAGILEMDDHEIWNNISNNSKSLSARDMRVNYDVGATSREHRKDWPGPGHIVGIPNELNAIELWKTIVRYLKG
jgi:phenylpropionate dioxygenase-like ring-hydroxylating dioxygenase large terminal subunit